MEKLGAEGETEIRLAVALSANHIDHIKGGDYVGEHSAFAHIAHSLRHGERRGAHPTFVRLAGAITDEIES